MGDNGSGNSLEKIQTLRGHVVWGHEVRSMTLCGESDELWFIDQTEGVFRRMYDTLSVKQYEPVFMEVQGMLTDAPSDGFGAEYQGGIIVKKIINMSREGFGCREQYDDFIYKAQGNEPGWSVTVSREGIRYTSINSPAPAIYPLVDPESKGETIRYVSTMQGKTIELVIMPEPCRDTMSGEQFSWKAKVKVDGKSYTGCAKKGDQN